MVFDLRHTLGLLLGGCLLVPGFLSCGKQDVVPEPERYPIAAQTLASSPVSTKGSGELSTESLRERSFGLFAWWRDAGMYFDGTDDYHLLLENTRMFLLETTGGEDRWRCVPSAFWPLGCSASFFAYAPYMDAQGDMLRLPVSANAVMPQGNFSVAADPSEQVDFCLSAPVLDWTSSKGDVPVRFEHAMSKVLFYVNADGQMYDGDDYRFKLKSLTLEGLVGENGFSFGGRGGFSWDALSRAELSTRTAVYSLSVAEGTLQDAWLPMEDELTDEQGLERYLCVNGLPAGVLYLLPQPLTSLAKVTLVIGAYRYDDVLGEWVEVDRSAVYEPVEIFLPEETVWEAGRTVCYSATVDISYYIDLEFSVTLLDWEGNAIGDVEFYHE